MSGSIDENVDVIRRGYERINRWEVERLFGVEQFFLDESAAVEAAGAGGEAAPAAVLDLDHRQPQE
jgi:hypothetical protein